MSTLILSAAGQMIGTALGGPIGGFVGRALGAAAGAVIDAHIVSALTPGQKQEGPRLTSVDVTASTEGAPITRMFGRTRIAGQMIWATRFEEQAETEKHGGKGGGGGVSTTTYTYFANFAVGLCEGRVTRIGRIWADGREVDQEAVTVRTHLGGEGQQPDSLIEAKEGTGNAPAYRGLAYIVFERLDLTTYGNRMPLVTAEVFRATGDLEGLVGAVAMIPGTTEFGYEPQTINRKVSTGVYGGENRHTLEAESDLAASLDMLADLAPACGAVNLVVAWFGTDLRCGSCQVLPKVETDDKPTQTAGGADFPWVVAGLGRGGAQVVSQVDGRPAFGGAPNDASVIACIRELKDRGFTVMVYPFVMMDVERDNTLPNPYSDEAGETGQPPYPWRGRITISPAPGFEGTPDGTQDASDQIAAFAGTATAADFAGSSGSTVTYGGAGEWSYRRFILHMATLCDLAGGVDAFCIGSEMVGMTRSRGADGAYDFVDTLIDLAGEARSILGQGTKIGYAADWSEYHSHRPGDGTGDVIFNLDPLWADADIDFVGIDNYLPLSDWRDGTEHLDYDAGGPTTVYDLDYLKANVEGGEYYDWFYPASGATGNEPGPERIAQQRTPIADTAHGEHWVFRNKDIRNWWANAHHDRPGGVRDESPTAWVPESKPVWFTELGVPAVDKGTNQPNVFHDPKSSESFFPYFSSGVRDDAIQRAGLQATIEYWADDDNNPQSSQYEGRMIDTARIFIWSWDARMVPSFPQDETTWADAPNWEFGHWISGRLGAAPGREALSALLDGYGFEDHAADPMGGVADGIVLDRAMSARAALDALLPAYLAHAVESGGLIRLKPFLGSPVIADYGHDALLEAGRGAAPVAKTRAQETELPVAVKVGYGEPANADQPGAVEARRLVGGSLRVAQAQLPVTIPEARARIIAEAMLHDAWASREAATFGLGPSEIALDPGDVIRLAEPDPETWRIVEIADGGARRLRAVRAGAGIHAPALFPARTGVTTTPIALGQPVVVFLDGALLRDGDDAHAGYVAAFVSPWPGGIALYRSPADAGFLLDQVLPLAATMGETAFDFFSGPAWRWDRGNELWVDLYAGGFESADELAVLNGANAVAVENADGEWEIVQFTTAELNQPGRWKLTGLLRGQRGSEHAMRDPVAAGARVLVLNGALGQPGIEPGQAGVTLTWRAGPANRDVTDPAFTEESVTIMGKGLRPLSPVHVRAEWQDDGDIHLSWIRRTRIGGDAWGPADVPLGEETEAYEVEILDGPGGDAVRTVTGLGAPAWLYTATDQATDFGAPVAYPDTLTVRVFQLSATFGRGTGRETTLFFPLPVNVA